MYMLTIRNLNLGKKVGSSYNLTFKAFDHEHIKSVFTHFTGSCIFHRITNIMNFMSSSSFLDISSSSAHHLDIVFGSSLLVFDVNSKRLLWIIIC